MNVGKLQRRWAEEMPKQYDKDTRIVCFDIRSDKGMGSADEMVDGYSFYQVELDRQMDYGHVKSQLIEAGFAQKDEFGLLMNAVEALIDGDGLSDDILAFREFAAYRKLCAETAKMVMSYY